MSDVQACLANFAVAAWANDDAALARSQEVIDDFLASRRNLGDEREALQELLAAFSRMNLDSKVATAIRGDLTLRLGALR